MNKRKICRIVETGLQITSATSLAISYIPAMFGDINKTALIVGTGVGVVTLAGSIIPHNILYRLYERDKILTKEKNSETYKKSLLNDMCKFDKFGMYIISKINNYDDKTIQEICNDYDLDMKIYEQKLDLLKQEDEEEIDDTYDYIDYLSSLVRCDEYLELKNSYYKKRESSVIEFKSNKQIKREESKLLKFIKNKSSNDDKE